MVVTEPLRQWHVHKTLAMVYRDAYNNQLNDRYRKSGTNTSNWRKQARETYFQIGVGLVADPIPKPAVPHVVARPVQGIGRATFYVAVTWVNASRARRQSERYRRRSRRRTGSRSWSRR